ncbi:hypothetical protein O9G_005208 [Rozella allomycis CSF55]|uniref:Uncharacterized protein n=1 Tax=Rozella allomycis (strain CSF55) TaxID=988480 RepID=A0A075B1I1_ROZAC|nr:hypothetical protein O9G_005208 [Rozella allomycis CSF55]|eukprot:EPZ34638.1 hypothetical protein O9G_005208 [Rozella allomycis CSF55]
MHEHKHLTCMFIPKHEQGIVAVSNAMGSLIPKRIGYQDPLVLFLILIYCFYFNDANKCKH